MLFSPFLMSALPVESFPLAGDGGRTVPLFHWHGGYSAFHAFVAACASDPSPAGCDVTRELSSHFKSTWAGIPESFDDWNKSGGLFSSAFDSFKRAEARLEATRFLPSDAIRTVFGPRWVIPEVLTGTPQCGRFRQRVKLPPLNIPLTVCVASSVKWENIARSTATIARASWDYVQAGGAINLTVHYVYGFCKPCGGADGVIFSIDIPLTNQASFASACSAQQFRGAALALACTLSGYRDDSLPVLRLNIPGAFDIQGRPDEDAKTRARINIKG